MKDIDEAGEVELAAAVAVAALILPALGRQLDAATDTGTKYVGNFRDGTVMRHFADGILRVHFTGGSVINGSNGTHEENHITMTAIFAAGANPDTDQPLQVLQDDEHFSCTHNGQVIYRT